MTKRYDYNRVNTDLIWLGYMATAVALIMMSPTIVILRIMVGEVNPTAWWTLIPSASGIIMVLIPILFVCGLGALCDRD